MSEAEALNEEEVKPIEKAKPTFTRDDYDAKQRSLAEANGWKDLEPYIEEGGDPEKWRSAEAFNVYGDMVGELKRTKKDFDTRLEGVHKLSQAQLAAQREELLAKRDQLIDEGGRTAEVKALDKQINTLNVPAVPVSNNALDDWNSRNAWIYEDSPKTSRAKDVFGREMSSGKSVEQAIAAVEADIQKNFSPRREAHIPESEKGKGSAGFKAKVSSVTWDDLSSEETKIYNAMPNAWKDKKEFLQAVQDERKAARGEK